MTNKPLNELESDLLQYDQAYAFGDIDKLEYERAKASLSSQIDAIKLTLKKQAAGRVVIQLVKKGRIDRIASNRALLAIHNAKCEEDLKLIEFKAAA